MRKRSHTNDFANFGYLHGVQEAGSSSLLTQTNYEQSDSNELLVFLCVLGLFENALGERNS